MQTKGKKYLFGIGTYQCSSYDTQNFRLSYVAPSWNFLPCITLLSIWSMYLLVDYVDHVSLFLEKWKYPCPSNVLAPAVTSPSLTGGEDEEDEEALASGGYAQPCAWGRVSSRLDFFQKKCGRALKNGSEWIMDKMQRVERFGWSLVFTNLTSFIATCVTRKWQKLCINNFLILKI